MGGAAQPEPREKCVNNLREGWELVWPRAPPRGQENERESWPQLPTGSVVSHSDLGYSDLSAAMYGDLCDKDYKRVRLSSTVDPFETAIMLQGDNRAALQTAKNPVNHKRMKHIHVAFGLTREAVQAKFIAPCYISSTDNTADIMTKELGTALHRKHTGRMLIDYDDEKFYDVHGQRVELDR